MRLRCFSVLMSWMIRIMNDVVSAAPMGLMMGRTQLKCLKR